jgi:hypothetical protein
MLGQSPETLPRASGKASEWKRSGVPDLAVLRPAYDEEASISRHPHEIREHVGTPTGRDRPRQVVIQDGSEDSTGRIVSEMAGECEEVSLLRPEALNHHPPGFPGTHPFFGRICVLPWIDTHSRRHVSFVADDIRDAWRKLSTRSV